MDSSGPMLFVGMFVLALVAAVALTFVQFAPVLLASTLIVGISLLTVVVFTGLGGAVAGGVGGALAFVLSGFGVYWCLTSYTYGFTRVFIADTDLANSFLSSGDPVKIQYFSGLSYGDYQDYDAATSGFAGASDVSRTGDFSLRNRHPERKWFDYRVDAIDKDEARLFIASALGFGGRQKIHPPAPGPYLPYLLLGVETAMQELQDRSNDPIAGVAASYKDSVERLCNATPKVVLATYAFHAKRSELETATPAGEAFGPRAPFFAESWSPPNATRPFPIGWNPSRTEIDGGLGRASLVCADLDGQERNVCILSDYAKVTSSKKAAACAIASPAKT